MSLPKEYLRQAWQHACRLILSRAPVEAITRQLSLALFMDAALDLGHKRTRSKRIGMKNPASLGDMAGISTSGRRG
jgi:hypothetical protein